MQTIDQMIKDAETRLLYCPTCQIKCMGSGYCAKCGRHNDIRYAEGYTKALLDFDIVSKPTADGQTNLFNKI